MTVTMEGVEYFTVTAVAEKFATTEMKILMLLRQQALSGTNIDGTWYVTAESVAGFKPGAGHGGVQPQCRTTCSASACGCR